MARIWGIAIVHAVLSMPVLTLIFRNYYKDIPQEIMSAAMMDSGSFWRIFVEIILPMSRQHPDRGADPADHLDLERLPDRPHLRRPRHAADEGGARQCGDHRRPATAAYNENMAAALLTAIPPLVIYFVLGKFFVQGITAGAIKG